MSVVVDVSVVEGTLVKATNTVITKLPDIDSASVLVVEIGVTAIVEEYNTTGGSGSVAVEVARESGKFAFASCAGAEDIPG